MLDRLFAASAVTAIGELLKSLRATGKLAVVGDAKLAAAFRAQGDVVAIGLPPRSAAKLPGAIGDFSTLEPSSLSGVIAVDATDGALGDWAPYVRTGGAIIVVDRVSAKSAAQASRRALCAGLTAIEQRRLTRLVVTAGLVVHLA